jgi:hypothetical protein
MENIMVREGPAQPALPPKEPEIEPYPAEKARGGEIILRTPLRRGIFITGLAGAVVLALIFVVLAFRGNHTQYEANDAARGTVGQQHNAR